LTAGPARSPTGPADLFRAFNRLALQGFGGVLPIAQRELVEREQWLTREQFVELLSISQVLPGPNVVNLALMFGDRHFGWRGGLAALAGMLAAPLALVLALTILYTSYQGNPLVAGALRGMGAVAAGLVFSTGLKLVPALSRNALGGRPALAFALATFGLVGIARVPLVLVLAALGAVSCAWAWRRLRP
jgi:chromate transporter